MFLCAADYAGTSRSSYRWERMLLDVAGDKCRQGLEAFFTKPPAPWAPAKLLPRRKTMRRRFLLLLAATAFVGSAAAQPADEKTAGAQAKALTGRWKSEVKGKQYATLTVKDGKHPNAQLRHGGLGWCRSSGLPPPSRIAHDAPAAGLRRTSAPSRSSGRFREQ